VVRDGVDVTLQMALREETRDEKKKVY
jgi:hypothetical protein